MVSKQELQVQQKREVDKREEATDPSRAFLPTTDIFETDAALNVVMEMPGVGKGDIEVAVEDSLLRVYGRINSAPYEDLQPIYTEYNVGHYARSFRLSNKIDQGAIRAEIKDGVLSLTLPKAEEAKPRTISVA
ncbi:MAG: Hsp20/alpha crystallin family protein [Caulobacteraceae bacterium]|nr:Hsp20/alpha crystallin family protein [Caulobacteraceae bacterium]